MRRALGALLVAALVAVHPAVASAQRLPPAYAMPPADREWAAGISYRDATIGSLFLFGTALTVGALTGSFLTSATAAVAAAGAYIIFDPGNSRVESKVAAPTNQDLRSDGGMLRQIQRGGSTRP